MARRADRRELHHFRHLLPNRFPERQDWARFRPVAKALDAVIAEHGEVHDVQRLVTLVRHHMEAVR